MPGPFGNYSKYKPFLREEFFRKCVYCRVPDTLKGEDGFGVDHYRPKKLFHELSTVYANLFYSCNQCNRNKGAYWPRLEAENILFIPNPCDHVMFAHLQFQGGSVRGKSPAGNNAIERLDLNDPRAVDHREFLLRLIGVLEAKVTEIDALVTALENKRNSGQLGAAQAADGLDRLERERQKALADLGRLSGD